VGNPEEDKIRRRRAQLMVHSYLYYELDTPMITDDKWQEWANELVGLQREHTDPIGFFDDLFKDFDGSTGYHLTKNEWARNVATRLLMYNPHTRDGLNL
jgi:hypothetical protein